MSVQLNPQINELDSQSICYRIYKHLYTNFFNAQLKKDERNPYGVEEGDDISIQLHNTAYGFAEAISMGVSVGEPGKGSGILLEYLKKTGGDMTGHLTANYGFEAGKDNNRIFCIVSDDEKGTYGVRISGNLDIGASCLVIGGGQFIRYDNTTEKATVSSRYIDFETSTILSNGEIIIGSKDSGIYLSDISLTFKGNQVYHGGNANCVSVDWMMKDGYVKGNLSVLGNTELSGNLKALSGLQLGANNKPVMSIVDNRATFTGFISFAPNSGIQIDDIPVLMRKNTTDILIGAVGGNLLLGSANTDKIKLQSHIATDDGQYTLVSKHGSGYFPESLTVRHNFGDLLLSSYRTEAIDEGIIIHKRLYFGTALDSYIYGRDKGLDFTSYVKYIDTETSKRIIITYNTLTKYVPSTSIYRPLAKNTASLLSSTNADFFVFNKPLEAKGHIGIDNSYTRLTDGSLFFTNESYLCNSANGIKHYGNAFFQSNISSEYFSSGFAGSGWSIMKNKLTDNIVATFDELTVRKKIHIYELEIQKINATNGSLWISDNCQGDTVQKL